MIFQPVLSDPDPILELRATDVLDDYVKLTWDVPEGDHDAYEVNFFVFFFPYFVLCSSES